MGLQVQSLPYLSNRKHLVVDRVQTPQDHLPMFPYHRILERQCHLLRHQTAPLKQPRVLQGPNLHKVHNQVVFHQEALRTLNRVPPQIPVLRIQALMEVVLHRIVVLKVKANKVEGHQVLSLSINLLQVISKTKPSRIPRIQSTLRLSPQLLRLNQRLTVNQQGQPHLISWLPLLLQVALQHLRFAGTGIEISLLSNATMETL